MDKKKTVLEKKKNREIGAKKSRVTRECTRLNAIFGKLTKDEKSVAAGLIQRAGYMRVTLEDYEKDINEGGSVELFRQKENAPAFERVRPVAQLYNTLNKNYQSIIKQLSDMLPKGEEGLLKQLTENDGFEDFVNNR